VDVLIGALRFAEAYLPALANASKHTTDIMISRWILSYLRINGFEIAIR